MFKDTKEIINTLEDAIHLFSSTNSALSREKAKLMVLASRHALQALALDFAERRFPLNTESVIDVIHNEAPRISKGHGDEKDVVKARKARGVK